MFIVSLCGFSQGVNENIEEILRNNILFEYRVYHFFKEGADLLIINIDYVSLSEIGEYNKNGYNRIIVLSSKDSINLNLFDYDIDYFLPCGDMRYRLPKAINKSLERIKISPTFLLKESSGNRIRRIPLREIQYIYRNHDKTYIVCDKEIIETTIRIRTLIGEINVPYIVQVHQSFILNIHYVMKYMYGEAYMYDDTVIPISKPYRMMIKKLLMGND